MTTLTIVKDSAARTEQLADRMFELYAEAGEASETALLREGFSRYELTTLGPAAIQIAEKRRIRPSEGFTRTDEEWCAIAATEAAGLIDEQAIFAHLRRFGIPSPVLGKIWPRLMRKLAASLALRSIPVEAA